MMQAKDYYKILGISESAETSEIKKAYRRIAKKNHPDQNPGDTKAEERFKEASEAYGVLSDTEKRKRYDALRRYGFADGPGGGQGFPGGGFPGGPGMGQGFPGGIRFSTGPGGARTMVFDGDYGDLNAGDLFGNNSPFADVFEQLFSGGAAGGMPRGAAGFGARGQRPQARSQSQVKGNGVADDFFRRDGADVHCTVWLKLDQIEKGAKVKVRTPAGKKVLVRIPAGTPIGSVFRLPGMGLEANGDHGDQFVHVEAVA